MKTSCKVFLLVGIFLYTGFSAAYAAMSSSVQPQYLRLQLAKDSVNTDDLVIRFKDDAKLTYNANEDARYMQGFGLVSVYSCSQDSVPLAINAVPYPKKAEAVQICVAARTDGAYQLNLTAVNNIPPMYDIWLYDKYSNDSLNIGVNKTYSFNILKDDPDTYGGSRFALVIRKNMEKAYKLDDFSARIIPGAPQVQVRWHATNELDNTSFTVERSTDMGDTFTSIGAFYSSEQSSYGLIDKNPAPGENIYRLRQDDGIDAVAYSQTVSVNYKLNDTGLAPEISVYPNPAVSLISFALPSKSNSNSAFYKIELMNSSGLVVERAVSHDDSWQGNVNNLPPGIYMLHVSDSASNSQVGSGKFIKL